MSNVVPFSFDGEAVRVVDQSGEPWFVLADVCAILDHSNPSVAAQRLDDDEKMTLNTTEGHSGQRGGAQSMTIINESGLYSLVLTSRKPEAKRFKKWVTSEVLPSIRKTGSYGVTALPDFDDPVVLTKLLLEHAGKRIEAERRAEVAEKAVEAAQPKVQALERIAEAHGSLCITDAAKTLQVTPRELFAYMRRYQWIYKRPGSVSEVGYQYRINAGWLEHKVTVTHLPDGTERIYTQVRVTPAGLVKLAAGMGVTPDLFQPAQ